MSSRFHSKGSRSARTDSPTNRSPSCRPPVRIVSAPCLQWFDEQDQDYRYSVLPPALEARVSVEAGTGLGW